MALQIQGIGPKPGEVAEQIREAVAGAIPGAEIAVSTTGPGHFEISVVSPIFEGKTRVQQHQLVYGAITDLMSGPEAPVHAIDRLHTGSTERLER